MAKRGMLISRRWCTGCHSCEVACEVEHGFPSGKGGIVVSEIGPWKSDKGTWILTYEPVLTRECDLCASRLSAGKLPSCVHHCQAACIEFGTLDELAEKLKESPESALFTL